jgi:Fe-S-cluster containining protein
MRDGPLLHALKGLVRSVWRLELALRRRTAPPAWTLAGTCRSCAKCCERPTIRAGRITWALPLLRRWYLAWQRRVNGFELVDEVEEGRLLVFRCTHFEPITRRCDSCGSRPFLCSDYPRNLMDEPWPELFPQCGHRPLARNAPTLREAIRAQGLPPEKEAELCRRLYLE